MPTIQIDFDVFKAITALRPTEDVSENEVLRGLFGLAAHPQMTEVSERQQASVPSSDRRFWLSEGVRFPLGLKLSHTFRDGRSVEATIVEGGVMVDGKVYSGLSPAGVAVAGYQLNGWRFWGLPNKAGKWVTADSLRG